MTFLSLSIVVLICAPSLVTGKDVGKNLVFDFVDPEFSHNKCGENTPANSSFLGKRTVYYFLSDYKLKGKTEVILLALLNPF